jgi:murein DD-endopeptidase MepM/ murein hydrolase activator NlpD
LAQSQKVSAFGRRKTEHTLILASGERIRHMTIRPWVVGLAGCAAALLLGGYFVATTYLILRDDLIGASVARQARIQHVYEDRIAALRAQVDRVTSRQMLDQRMMEDQVEKLMAHQAALSSRHGRLDAILERAGDAVAPEIEAPLPTPRPDGPARRAALSGSGDALDAIAMITDSTTTATTPPSSRVSAYAPTARSQADRSDRLFLELRSSLDDLETEQMRKVRALAANASGTAEAIAGILRNTGLDVPLNDETAMGGPYLPRRGGGAFDATLDELDLALNRLDMIRGHAARMPLGNPAEGHPITSRYGTRRDPFFRRAAFHAGIDFRVAKGESIEAAGSGTVIGAGRRGGYGKMVEIDHGEGVVTRYAHLSDILVSEGQTVSRGDLIGRAGSTGRSTGPHLHYEVRFHDEPVDPARFLQAGASLEPLLAAR